MRKKGLSKHSRDQCFDRKNLEKLRKMDSDLNLKGSHGKNMVTCSGNLYIYRKLSTVLDIWQLL